MKTFKTLDFFLQAALLIMLIIVASIGLEEEFNPVCLILAFGLLQLLSIIVNMAIGKRSWKKSSWRKIHLIGTIIVLAVIAYAFIQDSSASRLNKEDKYAMPGLDTLLFASIPAVLMSFFYFIITWVEWKKMKHYTPTHRKPIEEGRY